MARARTVTNYVQPADIRDIPVSHIMRTGIYTVHPDTPLGDAAHMLVVHKISGLPVLDADERLVGVITEADFLRALGVPSHHPTHSLWQTLEAMFAYQGEVADMDGTVADLMITDLITVKPDASVLDAIELLKKNRIKRVIVCDDQRRLHGIVTRTDFVKLFLNRMQAGQPQPA